MCRPLRLLGAVGTPSVYNIWLLKCVFSAVPNGLSTRLERALGTSENKNGSLTVRCVNFLPSPENWIRVLCCHWMPSLPLFTLT